MFKCRSSDRPLRTRSSLVALCGSGPSCGAIGVEVTLFKCQPSDRPLRTRSSLVALCGSGPSCGVIGVEFTLLTDDYPSETSWEIFDDAKDVVVHLGIGFIEKGRECKVSVCLLVGTCYRFVIKDTVGDGICCDYGDGSYQLRLSGTLFSEGGHFGSSASSGTFGTCDQEPVAPSLASSVAPSQERSEKPSSFPLASPSVSPSQAISGAPSHAPTRATQSPSFAPSTGPTATVSSAAPSRAPTKDNSRDGSCSKYGTDGWHYGTYIPLQIFQRTAMAVARVCQRMCTQ
jgi:hypothetical protein